METSNVLLGALAVGVVGYLGYQYFHGESVQPVIQTGGGSIAPVGVPVAPTMVAPVVSSVIPVAPVTSVAVGPITLSVETPIDNSGTIVNGKFADNAWSNVVFAAAEGNPSITGNTLLTVGSWNKYRAIYNAQHGNCCPEQLPDRQGLYTASQYRMMLGR